jgi:hypothetical protein
MSQDRDPDHATAEYVWSADFQAGSDQFFEAALAATPSERLKWLEEALAFAAKMGALPRRDESPES